MKGRQVLNAVSVQHARIDKNAMRKSVAIKKQRAARKLHKQNGPALIMQMRAGILKTSAALMLVRIADSRSGDHSVQIQSCF